MTCLLFHTGPVPASVSDFWRMIWEQKVGYVVMVTNLEEKGRVSVTFQPGNKTWVIRPKVECICGFLENVIQNLNTMPSHTCDIEFNAWSMSIGVQSCIISSHPMCGPTVLQIKCHKYWPDDTAKTMTQGSFEIETQEVLVLAEYTIRTFSLQKESCKDERIVRQFHFTVWPDHGVPEYPAQLLHFVHKVMQEDPTKAGPLVVHCSAGVGRTGTFITIFTELQRIKAEGNVDIFGFVRAMRRRRCFMVQTEVGRFLRQLATSQKSLSHKRTYLLPSLP